MPKTETKPISKDEPTGDLAVAAGSHAQGDFNASDIIMPELRLAQGAGAWGDWAKGKLIIDNEYEIEKPATVTVLSYKKSYVEYVPFGSDDTSRFFETEAELLEAGLSLKWVDNQRPSANALMDTMICVHGGAEADPIEFPYEFEGNRYLFCAWRIKGTSYATAAKPIVTADATFLKNNIRGGSFTMEPKKVDGAKGSYWVNSLKRDELNSAEFQKFVSEFM